MNDATPVLLELDEVVVHYPAGRAGLFGARRVVHAVDGLSLTISDGETFGLVGESGSESTAARIALHLEEPTAGVVRYRGEPLSRMDRAARQRFRREVQAVFQDPGAALNPRMRVADTVGRRGGSGSPICCAQWGCPPPRRTAIHTSLAADSASGSASPAHYPRTRV